MIKTPLDDRSWSGLLVQIFFFVILPLAIILLAISFISQSLHEQAMRSLVGERDGRAVRTAAAAIEADIREHMDAVRLVALQAETGNPQDLVAAYAQADFVSSQFDGGLVLLTPDGKLQTLAAGDGSLAALAGELSTPSRNLFGGPLSQFMTDAFLNPINGERMLVIIEAAPGREYLAAGAVSIQVLTAASLDSLMVDDHSAVYFLVDRQSQVIVALGQEGGSGRDLSHHPGVAAALRGLSGTTYLDAEDNQQVVAYSPLPILGWGLVSEEAWDMVSSRSLRTTQLAPLILAPFLLLMLVALWFGARQIVGPLHTLEERAARLAWGDFKAIQAPIGGLAEIRSLHAELVRMAEKVQAAQQGMHDYVGAITAAQEDERRRLAQELHDETIQALVALKQRAQLLRMQMKARLSEQELGELNELLELTEQAIVNLRRMIRALRPIYLEDLGLITALEILSQEASQTTGIPVRFRHEGEARRLDEAVELALYRITQEGLSNIAQHAQAFTASIELAFAPQEVTLTIADDGIGFQVPRSPAELAMQGHFGLLGISERAELIGAQLDIQSTGKGTWVQVVVKVEEERENSLPLGENA